MPTTPGHCPRVATLGAAGYSRSECLPTRPTRRPTAQAPSIAATVRRSVEPRDHPVLARPMTSTLYLGLVDTAEEVDPRNRVGQPSHTVMSGVPQCPQLGSKVSTGREVVMKPLPGLQTSAAHAVRASTVRPSSQPDRRRCSRSGDRADKRLLSSWALCPPCGFAIARLRHAAGNPTLHWKRSRVRCTA